MTERMKVSAYLTIGITFIVMLVTRVLFGINVFSFSMIAITVVGLILLILVQWGLQKLKQRFKITLIKVFGIIGFVLFVLGLVNYIYEWQTNSVFMFRLTMPGTLLFAFLSIGLVLFYLMIDVYVKKNEVYVFFQAVLILFTMMAGVFDLLLIFIGGSTITEVPFEEQGVSLYLVESTWIFSSTHDLYLKENNFYGSLLEVDGSWSCNDGCPTENPDAYIWTWVDSNTLVVSAEWGTFEPVTYYLP